MSESSDKSLQKLSALSIQALRANKFEEAVELSQDIIDRDENHASAHAVQFSSLFKSGEFELARRMGARAAALNPKSEFILNNQACLQLDSNQPAAAAGLLKALIDQFGERAQWLYNLALAQRMVGNYEISIDKFRRTLDLQPDHDRAAFQLADCLEAVGHREETIQAYDYVRLLRSKHGPTHSNFIHHAVVNNRFSEQTLTQELALWQARFVPKKKRFTTFEVSNTPDMKIGFLIGVIPERWLASMVIPLVNELAQRKDTVSVYWHDEKTPSPLFDPLVNIVLSAALSDAEFASQVRNDETDVIVDVCGMRRGSRQRALGLKVAGRQFGWLAHEGGYATPLVQTIDQTLMAQRFYIEPKEYATGATAKKTLIGINSQHGLTEDVINTWAYILHQLPDWKLHLDAQANHVISLLRQRFTASAINADRLIFDPALGASEGSIVLDNFIENDPVAASHALHSGGILVALSGPLFPAQQTAALLSQVDKADWLCDSKPEYVARALALANGELAKPVKAAQLVSSGLSNLDTFVTHFRNTISKENSEQ